MSFKIGDKVVYPNHGVGIIQQVCKHNIAGRQEEFYTLKIASNNSTVMIPIGNVDQVGLRRLCNEKQLKKLFQILKDNFSTPNPDWKDRYKDNVEKMKTGSIFDVAEVLKNLYFLSFQKSLSFREKKMFDRARQLVVSEIATVRGQTAEIVESRVDDLLMSAYRRQRTGTA
ncbi:MAG: CarD family transcriptional regulator [Acidobacteria bacterium]|nr:CarD family transcriptional regulator [Acidobacteriota bacterium]